MTEHREHREHRERARDERGARASRQRSGWHAPSTGGFASAERVAKTTA
ncbi:MAG: hypothetical protein ACT4PP_15465 [Sporichthyaceae bacterium]